MNKTVKIKKEVVFRSVAGENMLIPVGKTVSEYNGIFSMTEVGAEIWKAIENGLDEKAIVNRIMQEYEIDEATAEADVKEFIEKLCDFGIIEKQEGKSGRFPNRRLNNLSEHGRILWNLPEFCFYKAEKIGLFRL